MLDELNCTNKCLLTRLATVRILHAHLFILLAVAIIASIVAVVIYVYSHARWVWHGYFNLTTTKYVKCNF